MGNRSSFSTAKTKLLKESRAIAHVTMIGHFHPPVTQSCRGKFCQSSTVWWRVTDGDCWTIIGKCGAMFSSWYFHQPLWVKTKYDCMPLADWDREWKSWAGATGTTVAKAERMVLNCREQTGVWGMDLMAEPGSEQPKRWLGNSVFQTLLKPEHFHRKVLTTGRFQQCAQHFMVVEAARSFGALPIFKRDLGLEMIQPFLDSYTMELGTKVTM